MLSAKGRDCIGGSQPFLLPHRLSAVLVGGAVGVAGEGGASTLGSRLHPTHMPPGVQATKSAYNHMLI